MEKEPLVSVLMTAYNREKYIAEAIESVLASTYRNFELIIVDDASTDKTMEIAREYEKKDSRVRVYVNEKNLGDYPNRNRAASYAKGEYIMSLDSDDKIYRNGIELVISTMIKFPDCGMGMFYLEKKGDTFSLGSKELIFRHFFEKPFLTVGPGGTVLKREFFLKIGKYPEKYGPASDMYFNLKAASNTSIVLMPFDFFFYRLHEGQEMNKSYSYLFNNYRYLHDVLNNLNLPLNKKQINWLNKKNKRRFVVNSIKYLLKTGNFRKTQKAIRLADFSLKDALIGIFH